MIFDADIRYGIRPCAPLLISLAPRSLIDLNEAIAERAVTLRRQHQLKLPDAVVWASAQVRAMLLVTLDIKGFPADDLGVRVPYRV